jgi:hypothetical protein
MVEAIVVVAVFILFFVGMMYFENLYHQRIRVQQLARAGAVAYAMDACADGTDALAILRKDLGSLKGGGGGPPGGGGPATTPAATVPLPTPSKPVGQGGDPLGSAMGSRGFALDKVTQMTLMGEAGAGTQGAKPTFRATVSSSSYATCGDKQEKGNAGAVWDFVKGAFGSFHL